jgi:hypothetical protein
MRVKGWAAEAKGNGAIQRMARDHCGGGGRRSRHVWDPAAFLYIAPSNYCVHAIHHLKIVCGLSVQVVVSVGCRFFAGKARSLLRSNQRAITTEPRVLDSTVSAISVAPFTAHSSVAIGLEGSKSSLIILCILPAPPQCLPTPAKYSLGPHNALQMLSLQMLDSAASRPSTTRSCLLQAQSP